jgi:hypothetical protein
MWHKLGGIFTEDLIFTNHSYQNANQKILLNIQQIVGKCNEARISIERQ